MPRKSEYKVLAPNDSNYTRDLTEFGNNVRRYREQQGLSLDSLADLAGGDKAGISKLENGERNPGYITVLKIADALNTTPGALSPARYSDEGIAPAMPSNPRAAHETFKRRSKDGD